MFQVCQEVAARAPEGFPHFALQCPTAKSAEDALRETAEILHSRWKIYHRQGLSLELRAVPGWVENYSCQPKLHSTGFTVYYRVYVEQTEIA